MKTVIHLDKNDMVKILADHFNIDAEDVSVRTKMVYKGHGPMEHVEYECEATITTRGDK